jgi:hypothetical protein
MSSSIQNAKAKVSFGRLIRLPETGSFIGFVVVYIFFAILGGAVFRGCTWLVQLAQYRGRGWNYCLARWSS